MTLGLKHPIEKVTRKDGRESLSTRVCQGPLDRWAARSGLSRCPDKAWKSSRQLSIGSEEGPHRVPPIQSPLLIIPCALKQCAAMRRPRVHSEASGSRRGKRHKDIGQVLFSVAVVGLDTVAGSILQGRTGFVLDRRSAPTDAPPHAHDVGDRLPCQGHVGDHRTPIQRLFVLLCRSTSVYLRTLTRVSQCASLSGRVSSHSKS